MRRTIALLFAAVLLSPCVSYARCGLQENSPKLASPGNTTQPSEHRGSDSVKKGSYDDFCLPDHALFPTGMGKKSIDVTNDSKSTKDCGVEVTVHCTKPPSPITDKVAPGVTTTFPCQDGEIGQVNIKCVKSTNDACAYTYVLNP